MPLLERPPSRRDRARGLGLAVLIAAVLAACATPPEPPPPPLEPVSVAPPPPASEAPPPPRFPPLGDEVAKERARVAANEALGLLQTGEEAQARALLEEALHYEPEQNLAQRLMAQLEDDPEGALGARHFRYAVQPNDTLSGIAQRFLGDRLRFYILARYNGIANPSRIAVGQSLRIPGKAPMTLAAPAPQAAPEPAAQGSPPHAPESASAPGKPKAAAEARSAAEQHYAMGMKQHAAGDLDGAYANLSKALEEDAGHRQAADQRETLRSELVARHGSAANEAFHRQDLDTAIREWDKVLALQPDNAAAQTSRARAMEMKRRLEQVGTR